MSVFFIAILPAAVEWNAETYIIPKSCVKMSGYDPYRVSAAYAIWRIVCIPSFHSMRTWVINSLFTLIITINSIEHLAFVMDIGSVLWEVETEVLCIIWRMS